MHRRCCVWENKSLTQKHALTHGIIFQKNTMAINPFLQRLSTFYSGALNAKLANRVESTNLLQL